MKHLSKMPSGKKIIFCLICVLVFFPWKFANAVPASLIGNFKIQNSEYLEHQDSIAASREALATDSLLSLIQIDNVTRGVYDALPPYLNPPRILNGLDGFQHHTAYLPTPSYVDVVGVVSVGNDSITSVVCPSILPSFASDAIPLWFKKILRFENQIHDASVNMMMADPSRVDYADWNLPSPPRLPAEDYSFQAFLRRFNLPEKRIDSDIIPEIEIKKRYWLHHFNVGLQFSQAYVSPNWYQGGNSYISGLFNFTWNVDLNPTFNPKLLLQSSLQYKLAINSNPKGSLHKYNISQDLMQYTLKSGFKAFNHWFYSLNLLFQTQLLNAYPEDSDVRSSALLSPGTFNLGIGMTYTLQQEKVKFTLSISPLAYNLKTCINSYVDPTQFNISVGKKTLSEIGSSAEANLTWNVSDNISWKSRMFIFSDYSYFLMDWENTFNFQINRFLSTQIFLHPRFDSSSENMAKWHHWMLHEILSFGISYTFATPK